jgi:hypothetical protein
VSKIDGARGEEEDVVECTVCVNTEECGNNHNVSPDVGSVLGGKVIAEVKEGNKRSRQWMNEVEIREEQQTTRDGVRDNEAEGPSEKAFRKSGKIAIVRGERDGDDRAERGVKLQGNVKFGCVCSQVGNEADHMQKVVGIDGQNKGQEAQG